MPERGEGRAAVRRQASGGCFTPPGWTPPPRGIVGLLPARRRGCERFSGPLAPSRAVVPAEHGARQPIAFQDSDTACAPAGVCFAEAPAGVTDANHRRPAQRACRCRSPARARKGAASSLLCPPRHPPYDNRRGPWQRGRWTGMRLTHTGPRRPARGRACTASPPLCRFVPMAANRAACPDRVVHCRYEREASWAFPCLTRSTTGP